MLHGDHHQLRKAGLESPDMHTSPAALRQCGLVPVVPLDLDAAARDLSLALLGSMPCARQTAKSSHLALTTDLNAEVPESQLPQAGLPMGEISADPIVGLLAR